VAPASPSVNCTSLRYHKTGFWDIDIDNWPVLPTDCLAPISRNADRDIHHLPYQISVILASYVAVTIIVGTSILSIRRKRHSREPRRLVEDKPLESELRCFDPTSPSSFVSWMRNPLRRRGPGSTVSTNVSPGGAGAGDVSAMPLSPSMISMASFDKTVLEQDRATRQAEMDRLYAAVMLHDEARRSQASQVPRQHQLDLAAMQTGPRNSVASTVGSRMHLDARMAGSVAPDVPRTPISPLAGPSAPVKVIYPPSAMMANAPLSPTSPLRATDQWATAALHAGPKTGKQLSPIGEQTYLPGDMYPASPPPGLKRMRLPNQPYTPTADPQPSPAMRSPPVTALLPPRPTLESIGLPDRPNSSHSRSSRGRSSLKVRIGGAGRHRSREDGDEEERRPLSATFHDEQQRAEQQRASGAPPTPEDSSPESSSGGHADWPAPAPPAEPLPHPQLPQLPRLQTDLPPNGASLQATPRRPPNLTIKIGHSRTKSTESAVSQAASTLTFGAAPAVPKLAATPANGASKPLPLRVNFPESAPSTKTTFLDSRPAGGAATAVGAGPRTGRTPRTGVPQTPYTPYMPFTPVTPVTPRLVTRKERRDRGKQEGKTLLDESDLVRETAEEWD
jgi:hypothetical protein